MEQAQNSCKLLDRLERSEGLLFAFLSDVDRLLRLFKVTLESEQLGQPEEREIEDSTVKAFQNLSQMGQTLKEVCRDLPLSIPRQKTPESLRRLEDENLGLVVESFVEEIGGLIEKEKGKFPMQYNMMEGP